MPQKITAKLGLMSPKYRAVIQDSNLLRVYVKKVLESRQCKDDVKDDVPFKSTKT